MKKGAMFTIRGCFRSITNYPFLVFLLCVLIFMYISSPFMFSLLVSASPVLVCTAILLATLLFYGKPNIPQIKLGEKTINVERNVEVGLSKLDEKERSDETESENENGEVLEGNRELDDRIERQKDEWNYERFAKVKDVESCDSEMVDCLEATSRFSWKRQEDEEKEEEDDDGLDSGSDQPESSSSDESMAEVMPMLDELHPLLIEDSSSQLLQMSRVCSEAPSEHSPRSSISSIESVDEATRQQDGDGNVRGNEKDQEKTAILWTEEDQKNLMDVRSSEIERNKRLENLLLRRMRRNMSMLPEINLIDLESSDFPHHITHISTTRHNPFDLPHDSYVDLGLPPIPSSAPPVLLPRMNPFDVPYEPSEGNPYRRFQEDLKTSQSREAFFRRHENHTAGPSVFSPKKQETQDLRWGPFFIPEQIALELGSVEYTDTDHGIVAKPACSSSFNETENEGSSLLDTRSHTAEQTSNMSITNASVDSEHLMENGEMEVSPDSEADFVEANEKLISTPSAGGNTCHFHDRLLHEHIEEVQVPDTPVQSREEVKSIQNIHIPKLHEFDHNILPTIKSPSLPDSISRPPRASDDSVVKTQSFPHGHCAETSNSEENTKVISVNRRLSTPF